MLKMVGTPEERRNGHNQAATEWYEKYRKVCDIHNLYEQRFHEEMIADRFDTNRLYKLAKELKKINKLKEKIEIESERATRYRTQRTVNFQYENQITE